MFCMAGPAWIGYTESIEREDDSLQFIKIFLREGGEDLYEELQRL